MLRPMLMAAALLAGGFVFYWFGLRDPVPEAIQARADTPAATTEENEAGDEQPKKERTQFAQDRVASEASVKVKAMDFDGKRAMGYLELICSIGPRMSGTRGMKRQIEVLDKHFRDLGLSVEMQSFAAKQASQREIEMTNLIISINPEKKRRVILCSHYDTRPIADQEPDPRKWRETFVSANDGGSGVAFLMEIAHHLPKLDLNVGIDLVLFDGEEYIFERNRDEYFFGSKHFAQAWRKNKQRPDYVAAVLFDMIAGKNPKFPVEGYSWLKARELCIDIWRVAADQKCEVFQNRMGDRVLDDHLALQNVGIPAIDIIDFDYPHWHRLSDTPENCSAEGMIQVARVMNAWLQRVK